MLVHPFLRLFCLSAVLLTLGCLPLPGRAQSLPVWQDVTPDYPVAQGNTLWLTGADYGNGTFVVLGYVQSFIVGNINPVVAFTSTDGKTWTSHEVDLRLPHATANGSSVRFVNGRFYCTAENIGDDLLYSSADGVNWDKPVDLGSGGALTGLAGGNGRYVIARGNGTAMHMLPLVSADLTHWDASAFPGDTTGDLTRFGEIDFSGGRFILAGGGDRGPYVYTSADGVSWTAANGLPDSYGFGCLAVGNDVAMVQDDSGPGQFLSTDGVTWVAASPGIPTVDLLGTAEPQKLSAARFLGGKFVGTTFSLRSAGPTNVYISDDAQNWMLAATVPTTDGVGELTSDGNGTYLAVVGAKIYAGSVNPVTITPPPPPPVNNGTPDLSSNVDSVTVKLNKKGTRTTIAGNVTVFNHGTKAAKNVAVSAFLASGTILDENHDRYLGSVWLPNAGYKQVGKNGKSAGPIPFKFKMSGLEFGTISGKFLLFVVDPDHTVTESDETNNVSVTGPLP